MENGAGVKVTEFHEKLKDFRACVSSKHCVSHSSSKLSLRKGNYYYWSWKVVHITNLVHKQMLGCRMGMD